MSIENNTPVEPQETDLDAFSEEFFGRNEPEQDKTKSEVKEEKPEEGSDAPVETDTQTETGDDDTPETDDDDDEDSSETGDEEESEDEPEDKPAEQPKKKNRYQERIDEVVGRQREAERKLEAALKELNTFKQNNNPEPTPVVTEDTSPKPDDTKEDGTEKYPLGEFDPAYIRDLTRHTLAEEKKAMDAQSAQEREQAKLDEQRTALDTEWQGKLVDAQERYPDFQEKGQELIDSFDGIDQDYGEYLTTTIMSMEYGPDVLYHLANNPDEAKAIVDSGARKATVLLGRLEAKFADTEAQKQLARPKVSSAPTPPPRAKGSAPAKVRVEPDTDDLDSFEREFFKPKKY